MTCTIGFCTSCLHVCTCCFHGVAGFCVHGVQQYTGTQLFTQMSGCSACCFRGCTASYGSGCATCSSIFCGCVHPGRDFGRQLAPSFGSFSVCSMQQLFLMMRSVHIVVPVLVSSQDQHGSTSFSSAAVPVVIAVTHTSALCAWWQHCSLKQTSADIGSLNSCNCHWSFDAMEDNSF